MISDLDSVYASCRRSQKGEIMIKKLFLGIPTKLLLCNAGFTLAWGIMNAYLTVALARVTASDLAGSEFVQAAIFFVAYILIWEITEFVCDSCDGICHAYIRNATFEYYYEKLYYTRPEVLQKGNSGYVAGILVQLVERKCSMMFGLLIGSISVIYLIYLIFHIAVYSVWFSVIIFLLSAFGIMIRIVCSKRIAPALQEMTIAKGEQTRIFMDGINNIATIQKLRGLSFLQQKAKPIHGRQFRSSKKYTVGNEIGFTLYKLVNYLVCPICMIAALEIQKTDSSFPLLEFMAYLSIVTIQMVHNGKNIAELMKEYSLFTVSQKEMDRIVKEQSTFFTAASIEDHFTDLEIKNISYQYQLKELAASIVIDNFVVHKGEKICITGESGQGKTTLLKILSGIIETDQKIFVDGEPLKQNIDAVYIAQDTEMLDMTLRENLTFGKKEISDETLILMLKTVGLSDWFRKQEKGLDTMLGERGVFVSTGQRQRLNVLRGLLIDKQIYLLDEPTSNVDHETEEKMIQLMRECLAGKTVVIVTHREKIRELCDREYFFCENRLSGGGSIGLA